MDSYTVIDWLTLTLMQIDLHILISLQPIFRILVMQIQQKNGTHLNVRTCAICDKTNRSM